ncbi:MAG: DUF4956 domain-containing protein [Cetobacterium sp.]|nr:DUF4956 domain-containing protein [Cetobacterium sp.]
MNQILKGSIDLNSIIQNAQTPKFIIQSILMTIVFSAIIYYTYKFSYDTLNYNKKFNITLVMIAFLSTVLMDLVQSNLAISLGMLGSLSIVRFRTNIKDYRDIGFIFWSMAVGIASATQNLFLCLISSCLIAIFMIITGKESKFGNKLLLVVRGKEVNLNTIQEVLDKYKIRNNIKAKNILSDSFELVYEIKVSKNQDNLLIDDLLKFEKIDSVNILAPSTEVI